MQTGRSLLHLICRHLGYGQRGVQPPGQGPEQSRTFLLRQNEQASMARRRRERSDGSEGGTDWLLWVDSMNIKVDADASIKFRPRGLQSYLRRTGCSRGRQHPTIADDLNVAAEGIGYWDPAAILPI